MDEWRMKIALAYLKAARKAHQDYDDEVQDWYRNGDGRSPSKGGKGYRFPRCIHGANLWVDHDIPCGECEMHGSYFDYLRELGWARDRADHEVSLFEARCKLLNEATRMGMPFSEKVVLDWVGEPVRRHLDA